MGCFAIKKNELLKKKSNNKVISASRKFSANEIPIFDVVKMEEIPMELIFNWDQTGINLVPASLWTMAPRGSKRIEVKGLADKRQITGVFCGSLLGDFLPFQLIYGGKTDRCHPSYNFPSDWNITHSDNHWSNESTMVTYIEQIIVPFVDKIRELGIRREPGCIDHI